jgi:hypothetical protein
MSTMCWCILCMAFVYKILYKFHRYGRFVRLCQPQYTYVLCIERNWKWLYSPNVQLVPLFYNNIMKSRRWNSYANKYPCYTHIHTHTPDTFSVHKMVDGIFCVPQEQQFNHHIILIIIINSLAHTHTHTRYSRMTIARLRSHRKINVLIYYG